VFDLDDLAGDGLLALRVDDHSLDLQELAKVLLLRIVLEVLDDALEKLDARVPDTEDDLAEVGKLVLMLQRTDHLAQRDAVLQVVVMKVVLKLALGLLRALVAY